MLRLIVLVAVVLLAGAGCSRKSSPAPAGSSLAPPPSSSAEVSASPTRGTIAGVRYLELMTGGARADDRVAMIVALHAMGGDPDGLLPLFRRYGRRARVVLPYGHPSGGMYIWFDSARDDVAAPVVTRETDRLAVALGALVTARPTVGKPLVTGFSQGGIMTFSLAVTHPEAMAAAFPISGLLPVSLYPSETLGAAPRPATLPPLTAFHGAADLAVPILGARESIVELQRAGFTAELHEYAGVEHDIGGAEEADILDRIGRAADGLAGASRAP